MRACETATWAGSVSSVQAHVSILQCPARRHSDRLYSLPPFPTPSVPLFFPPSHSHSPSPSLSLSLSLSLPPFLTPFLPPSLPPLPSLTIALYLSLCFSPPFLSSLCFFFFFFFFVFFFSRYVYIYIYIYWQVPVAYVVNKGSQLSSASPAPPASAPAPAGAGNAVPGIMTVSLLVQVSGVCHNEWSGISHKSRSTLHFPSSAPAL